MATLANWNGHTFEVRPGLIRSFTDLSVRGSCETTEKNSDKQKYVEHKYGNAREISLNIQLNALTGVSDVYGEAMQYVQEATDGACEYFYIGSSKLSPAKQMLTGAEIGEIVTMPARGDQWISCNVKLTFKQGTKNDGSKASGSGSGGGPGKTKTPKETEDEAKDKSKSKLPAVSPLLSANFTAKAITGQIGGTIGKSVKANKTNATSGRNCDITLDKITLDVKLKGPTKDIR